MIFHERARRIFQGAVVSAARHIAFVRRDIGDEKPRAKHFRDRAHHEKKDEERRQRDHQVSENAVYLKTEGENVCQSADDQNDDDRHRRQNSGEEIFFVFRCFPRRE